jgi:hypothetical protein
MKVDGKEACTGFVKTAVAQKRYMLWRQARDGAFTL